MTDLEMKNAPPLRILVAGASGYIGRALIPRLLEKYPHAEITALSRSQQESDDPRVIWRAADLFSLKSLEQAAAGQFEVAYYLVHSMGPTAHLDQGSFADYDLILADNFARVVKGVKHVIYLGGLIPQVGELSLHLQSRLEVEETFRSHQLPLTVFRAGLILGDRGSSWQILLKLVMRLPVMICPRWTQTLTTPVDLETVVKRLSDAPMEPESISRTRDLAGCQPITYLNMMKETARSLGVKRFFFVVPYFSPTLSRLWVTLITNTPKDLVYPLIESLRHPMVARGQLPPRTYAELLEGISMTQRPGRSLFKFQAQRKTVRSVQRLPLPIGKTAEWVKLEYARWLPQFFRPFISVKRDADIITFYLLGVDLLELQLSSDRSHADRQLMYIKKGTLVAESERGRLEFRTVLGRKFVLAAIHDFKPRLPWFLYSYSQAIVHLVVMRAFGWHLARVAKKTTPEISEQSLVAET